MQNLCFIIGNARKCLGTIFPDSSMVERLAVNEDVQGSSPCREATIVTVFRLKAIYCMQIWLFFIQLATLHVCMKCH